MRLTSGTLAAAMASALLWAEASSAYTVGGAVASGAPNGGFVKLEASPGLRVGRDTFDDPNLYAFDENQNILLEADVRVDVGGLDGWLPAGTIVASHYVFFDPAWGAYQSGYVEFDSRVLGVATQQDTLKATDFLADTEVIYLNPTLRGLEWEDAVWIDLDNPYRIRVNWAASTPGDYIRVFTAISPGV